jgi:hypothetical protein
MNYYRQIKKVINDKDYFKLRRKKFDEVENLRYRGNQIRNNNLNLNNNDIIDDNNNYNLILSNNIVAENNIGKFKENIKNREMILEKNYKNLNDYQSSIYNNNYDFKKSYKDIHYRNYPGSSIRKSGKRIYKSGSAGNVLKNNFYLSQLERQMDNNTSIFNRHNYYIDYTNQTLGKKRTDITDDNFLQKYTDKQNFADYINKNVEIQNENRKISEEKNNLKRNNLFKSRLKERAEIKMENNYFNSLAEQNLLGEKESKILYKNLLDQQIKNNITDKLMNENLTYNDIIQNRNYSINNERVSERKFLNKNNFVDVNPYNRRNYFLGNSSLKNDVINNPRIIYKYNKYIFPQIATEK